MSRIDLSVFSSDQQSIKYYLPLLIIILPLIQPFNYYIESVSNIVSFFVFLEPPTTTHVKLLPHSISHDDPVTMILYRRAFSLLIQWVFCRPFIDPELRKGPPKLKGVTPKRTQSVKSLLLVGNKI